MTKQITKTVAKKVLSIIDAGLCRGVGTGKKGNVCVEVAVSAALGEGWGNDEPSCVAPSVRSLKIQLNDSNWSSKEARAKGLRRIGLAQLGTKDTLDEKEFARRLVVMALTKTVPFALRMTAETKSNEAHKAALLAAADRCAKEGTKAAALAAANAAANAANAASAAALAAANAAANAANAAAFAAANAAANATAYAAAFAAAFAANAAALAAANAADFAANAADLAAKDQVLGWFAEAVVEILIDMKAPGTKFLYLTEE